MRLGSLWSLTLATLTFSAIGCGDSLAPTSPDAAPGPDAPDAVGSFDVSLFEGNVAHRFDFTISEAQAREMEETGFDPGREDNYYLDVATYADDLTVTDGDDLETRAFGKVEVKLIGQSSNRPWNRIPNLRVDMDQFQPGLELDNVEHVRFNNGQIGGIYREAIALRLWGALGHAVPRTSFAWVTAANQWGDQRVPYTLVEVYKPDWCEAAYGAPCANLWEGYGDLWNLRGNCQFAECDDTRIEGFADAVANTSWGPGYMDALASWIDWPAWHRFQCMAWITATGDDYIHNSNNIVVVERADGKMEFLPYSTDISAGQDWYPDTTLFGGAPIAQGCQNDPACWDGLLTTCDALLDDYETMDVVGTIVDPVIQFIANNGMSREGDEERAAHVRDWYSSRADKLRTNPVWTTQPCQSHDTCADREDGKTWCEGVCVEPPPRCFDGECPEGMYCDWEQACRF